jgi:hypothetical protein
MAATPRAPAPAWTRHVQGWSFALFFVSLIFLSFVAVEFWNAGNLEMSGYFAGLASVVPLLLVVLVFYARPIWGISVPLAPEAVAIALEAAASGRSVEPVSEREGPFARCVAVVYLGDPACTIGWSPEAPALKSGGGRAGSVVVLRPETRDKKALADLRESLRASLLGTSGGSA